MTGLTVSGLWTALDPASCAGTRVCFPDQGSAVAAAVGISVLLALTFYAPEILTALRVGSGRRRPVARKGAGGEPGPGAGPGAGAASGPATPAVPEPGAAPDGGPAGAPLPLAVPATDLLPEPLLGPGPGGATTGVVPVAQARMSEAAARAACAGVRHGGGHPMRLLIEAGLISGRESLARQAQLFEHLATGILRDPVHAFSHRVGVTAATGYVGWAAGRRIVLFVAEAGPYAGSVVHAVVPDQARARAWGLR